MTLALAVADSGDGTGGVATVSGVNVAATVSVYYSLWTGEPASYAWTLLGSRTGNGTVAAALSTGLYQWQAVSVLAGATEVGPLVYQPLSDADEEAVHFGILSNVKARIDSLALSGLPATKTMRKWIPRVADGVPALPACLIAPLGAEQYEGILTSQDDVGYPVVVAILDKLQGDPQSNMNRDLLWRQKIAKAFRFQRLPGSPAVINAKPMPGPVVDPGAFESHYLASVLAFSFTSREGRGLS